MNFCTTVYWLCAAFFSKLRIFEAFFLISLVFNWFFKTSKLGHPKKKEKNAQQTFLWHFFLLMNLPSTCQILLFPQRLTENNLHGFKSLFMLGYIVCLNLSSFKWHHICKKNAFVWWTAKMTLCVSSMKNLPFLFCQTAYSAIDSCFVFGQLNDWSLKKQDILECSSLERRVCWAW